MIRNIPLSIPNFEGNERKYVNDAIEKGWVSSGGSYVSAFEEKIAEFLHVDNVSVCQSGTSAIHLGLIEIGVEPGDVVLVPPLTFIAAVNPVKYQYATPVFIDCDDSLCMDPLKLEQFCENECEWNGEQLLFNKAKVKALIVVHVFGNMADMLSIMSIANRFNLKVIEDATEALGTKYTEGIYNGKYAGTIGHFGAFSFNGNKIITTGGGGAITSNLNNSVDHIRYLSTQAKDDPCFYIHNEIGYNYRMTNIQAALGVAQLEELPEFIIRKQKNYNLYKNLFEGLDYLELFSFREGTSSNKWLYSININKNLVKTSMKDIIISLKEKGIETRAIWGLINEQRPYLNEHSYGLEKSKIYSNSILNIPSSTQITENEIIYVVNEIKELFTRLINDK